MFMSTRVPADLLLVNGLSLLQPTLWIGVLVGLLFGAMVSTLAYRRGSTSIVSDFETICEEVNPESGTVAVDFCELMGAQTEVTDEETKRRIRRAVAALKSAEAIVAAIEESDKFRLSAEKTDPEGASGADGAGGSETGQEADSDAYGESENEAYGASRDELGEETDGPVKEELDKELFPVRVIQFILYPVKKVRGGKSEGVTKGGEGEEARGQDGPYPYDGRVEKKVREAIAVAEEDPEPSPIDHAELIDSLSEAAAQVGVSVQADGPIQTAKRLVNAVRSRDVGVRVTRQAAKRARRDDIADSTLSTDLVELLYSADRRPPEDVEQELKRLVSEIDEAATTHAMVDQVDKRNVRELAQEVQDRAGDVDSPVSEFVTQQVEVINRRIENASKSNRKFQLYVEGSRLEVYEALLNDVERRRADEPSEGISEAISTLRDKEAEFEALQHKYHDLNARIPEHFRKEIKAEIQQVVVDEQEGRRDVAKGRVEALNAMFEDVLDLYRTRELRAVLARIDRS